MALALAASLSPAPCASAEFLSAASLATLGVEEVVSGVEINGEVLAEGIVLLRLASGEFLLPAAELARWRLVAPASAPVVIQDTSYFPTHAFAFKSVQFDRQRQVLSIQADAEAFVPSQVTLGRAATATPLRPGLGGFLNYDLSALDSGGARQGLGLLDLGVFSPMGVFESTALGQTGAGSRSAVRLDTSFTIDDPAHLTTLRLGDAITQPGAWGYASRFGGLQWGTNFATQPGLVTIPLQTVAGQATLPSTVDVYVNNVLTGQRQVAPGPFAIHDLPVVTGDGQITLVVRDILGREQVITQSFASNIQLLKAGLADYSVEVGALRQNYGIDSDDYGPALASGTYRYGLTDRLTAEVHGEAEEDLQNIGVSGALLVGHWGTLLGTVAASHAADLGQGHLLGAGFERLSEGWSFAAHGQWASRDFDQIGVANLSIPTSFNTPATASSSSAAPVPADVALLAARPRLSADASVSTTLGRFGSVGLAYVTRKYFEGSSVDVATLNYSVNVWGNTYLGAIFQRTLSYPAGNQFSVFLSVPLSEDVSASLTRQTSQTPGVDSSQWVGQIQRNPPAGVGWGYLLQASDHGDARVEGTYQSAIGTAIAETERQGGVDNTRLEVQGGIGFLGGTAFLSRPVVDSFALVRAPDAPNARVYENNLLIGRTDANGELILPSVRPYENNVVTIEQLDLKLDVEFKSLSMTFAPYRLSGVVLDFPLKRTRQATLRVVRADGTPLAPGTRLTVNGGKEVFPMGANGVTYLTGLKEHNTIEAHGASLSCRFTLLDPQTRDPLPDLGTHTCAEVAP